MSFTRANPAGWSFNAKLTSAQINALDIDHANALDKTTAGDTLSGAIAMTATANINAGYSGNITSNVAGGIQATVAGGIQSTYVGGITPTVPSGISSSVASGIVSTVASGISTTAIGGLASGVAGGVALTGGSADWPTFGVNGASTRSYNLILPLDFGIAMTSSAISSPPGTQQFQIYQSSYQSSPSSPTTQCGGFLTQSVSTSGSAGYGYYVPLRQLLNGAANGATLAGVALTLLPNSSHTSLPSFMPRIGIFAVSSGLAPSTRLSLSSVSNFAIDSSATVGAYNAGHSIVYTCNQNNVLNTQLYQYFAIIIDEGDPTSFAFNYYQGLLLSFSNVKNMSW